MKYIKSYNLFEGKMYCQKCGSYTGGLQKGDICNFCKDKERQSESDTLYCTVCNEYIGEYNGNKCNSCREESNED